MSTTPDYSSLHYTDAQAALKKSVEQLQGATKDEQLALLQEYVDLQDMQDKLEHGRVDLVIFGEISTGKSALINALTGQKVAEVSVRGGSTRDVSRWDWADSGYSVPGFAQSRINIWDTPGINEIDGEQLAQLAHDASQRADLLLFVTDSDINSREFEALSEIALANKPIILVFNKIDLYSREQRERILQVLRDERLPHMIGPEDIVETAADPMEREYVIESPDGSERTEIRKPKPQVTMLKDRIIHLLAKEGKALIALNAALFAADTSDKLAATKMRLRDETATRIIWSYAALKGIAVAVNPIPIADVLGGTASDVTMVMHLARIYGIELTREKALDLIKSILKVAGGMVAIEWATHAAANVFKGLTLGMATVVTALPQGAVGGYGSYIVGQAAKYYLEHGASWGDEGPKAVIRRILDSTDRDSVMERLKEEIHKRIKLNRYAKS